MNLIYLSPVPWNSFTQRPHAFVRAFQKYYSGAVIWVDPYPTRLPVWSDLKNRPNSIGFEREIPSWMTVRKPKALPIEPLTAFGFINSFLNRKLMNDLLERVENYSLVIGKPSRFALDLLMSGDFERTFYDAMDDFPFFYSGLSRKHMSYVEREVAKNVKKIVVSSTALSKKFSQLGFNSSLVLNGCYAAETLSQKNTSDKIVAGYIGTIANWFDWQFVIGLAKSHNQIKVHLYGPIHTKIPADLPGNIKLFPPINHRDVYTVMGGFSVGLIPFKKNELTQCVDPIKYYEYKQCHLPIVSTAFGEMEQRRQEQGVYIIDELTSLHAVDFKTLLATSPAADEIWANRFNAFWG